MENLSSFERYLIKYYLKQKLDEMRYNNAISEKIIQLEKIINKLEVF